MSFITCIEVKDMVKIRKPTTSNFPEHIEQPGSLILLMGVYNGTISLKNY